MPSHDWQGGFEDILYELVYILQYIVSTFSDRELGVFKKESPKLTDFLSTSVLSVRNAATNMVMMRTVLEPIKRLINTCSILGCMSVKIVDDVSLEKVTCDGHVKASLIFLVAPVNSVLVLFYSTTLTNYVLDFDFLTERFGMGLLDIICFNLPFYFNLISAIAMYILTYR